MKTRPSLACANAVALASPDTHASFFVKPAGTSRPLSTRTTAVDQAVLVPAASRPRARSTCWPLAQEVVSTTTPYGAVVSSGPTATPSTWNSTATTPEPLAAVADKVTMPARPSARFAGAVSVTVCGKG